MSLTQLLSWWDMLAWLLKNIPWHRCFQERHMHNLPRLNGCGESNERQYCFLSVDEILCNFNEPFFGNFSLTEVLSFGSCVDMVVKVYIPISMFQRTPYAQSSAAEWLWVSNKKQYCFLSADGILFNFDELFFRNMSLIEVLSFGGCADMVVKVYILISMLPRTLYLPRRDWMAAGYQMKGNIVFYLLMKCFSLLTSRFSAICL